MKRVVLFFMGFTTYYLCAQTGIGGVGNNSGTSTLSVWYDANQGVTTSGTAVTQWTDQSGYGNNATPPGSSNRPTFTTGAINSYPVLTFDGSSDYLTAPDAASLDLTTWSIFIVGKINTHKNYNAIVVKGNDAQENYEFLTNYPGTGNIHYPVRHTSGGRSTHSESGATFSNTSYGIYQLDYDQSNFNVYIDGSNTETDAENRIPLTNNSSLYIGNEQGTSGRNFSGTIAEIAMFSSPVNSAQRIIINNAMAAKYGFSLAANDIYNEDDAGKGNYDHDVAGIGRVDASNIHNDAQGTGMVRILNPRGLDNDEFLIWGHDNGIAEAYETTDVPAGVEGRFIRVWRVSEVSSSGSGKNVGNIDMRWDLTNLGSITASDLRLLIDTDNDGTFADETPISGAVSLGGNIYEFFNVPGGSTGIRNNRRFTLATADKAVTPLPIDLLSFNANVDEDKVNLNWVTASEVNNDYFTVEKSLDGKKWKEVVVVPGAGNSNQTLEYFDVDYKPYKGVSYYRLKQTDYDGAFSYSNIVPVKFVKEYLNSGISVFPSPAQRGENVKVRFTDIYEEEILVVLRDIKGQEFYSKVILNIDDGVLVAIPIEKQLPPGIYLVTASSENQMYSQKIVVK